MYVHIKRMTDLEAKVFINVRAKVLLPDPLGPCTIPMNGSPDSAAAVASMMDCSQLWGSSTGFKTRSSTWISLIYRLEQCTERIRRTLNPGMSQLS